MRSQKGTNSALRYGAYAILDSAALVEVVAPGAARAVAHHILIKQMGKYNKGELALSTAVNGSVDGAGIAGKY